MIDLRYLVRYTHAYLSLYSGNINYPQIVTVQLIFPLNIFCIFSEPYNHLVILPSSCPFIQITSYNDILFNILSQFLYSFSKIFFHLESVLYWSIYSQTYDLSS